MQTNADVLQLYVASACVFAQLPGGMLMLRFLGPLNPQLFESTLHAMLQQDPVICPPYDPLFLPGSLCTHRFCM